MLLRSITRRSKTYKLIFSLLLLSFLQDQVFAQPRSASQPEDALLFREGEVLLSKGETEKALWRFKRLITEFPSSSLTNEAKFRMGVCYTQLKKPKDAIRVLGELFSGFLSPARMFQVFALLGDNYVELKEPLSALQWYGKGLLLSGQAHEQLKEKVKTIIDILPSEEDLNKVESLYRGAYGGGYAKLRLARMAKVKGNDALLRKMVAELEAEYKSMDYLSEARELMRLPQSSPRAKYTLGVVLPLSGPYQSFGLRALQGIQLAVKEMNAVGKTSLVSLVLYDSKGNPKEVERGIQELVLRDRAIALLGPLLGTSVEVAAKKAQLLRVSLLTLSQKEPSQGKAGFVFQNSLTPLVQIQALVPYVTKELGLRTFAVFYPNSPYGRHFKNLFAQEVSHAGGKVMGSVAYQEDQTDFGQEIREFFKIRTLSGEDSRKKKSEEFNAGVAVNGIFIPDAHDRVGLLLSQMAYYDIKGSTFLGINAWNGPSLLPVARSAAEGAIFVDTFFNGHSSPAVRQFVEEFRRAYQREPETLEAISYDGVKFLGEILRSKNLSSPIQLRDEILQFHDFMGVSGLKGFDEQGRAIRALSILKVHEGKIELVSP